jgi:hypothetical protein
MIRMIQRIDTKEPPFCRVCRWSNAPIAAAVTASGLTQA